MTQILVGEILQPAMRNKWRLIWTPNTSRLPQNDNEIQIQSILKLQAISVEMTDIPFGAAFGINSPGALVVTFEHDLGGEVGKAIEFLKSVDTGTTISLDILDGDHTITQTIVYNNVVINNQKLGFDYALSETLKSVVYCTFGSMEVL